MVQFRGCRAWQYLAAILLLFLIDIGVAAPANAFGLKTHLWIANRLADDIADDCRIKLDGVTLTIDADVCASVRGHRGAFLAGSLGPDAYPDLITGQVTTHPGIKGDWQTSEWLAHLYGDAPRGPELAFAAGYLVHAASDTWAHSYVNAYSGDIFALGDERAVERRHFVLEKYIDHHLPAGEIAAGSMDVPADFLRDRLIFNGDAARLARKSGAAPHIPAMFAVREAVVDLDDRLNGLNGTIEKTIALVIAENIELTAKVATGEIALEGLMRSLELQEARLRVEQQAFDAAEGVLNDAIDAVEKNRKLIETAALEARLAREAANIAEREGSNAVAQIARIKDDIVDLQRRLANEPTHVADRVCEEVKECKKKCPIWGICDLICEPAKLVCRTVNVINKEWRRLTDRVAGLQKRQNALERDVQQFAIKRSAELARESAALKAKLQAEQLSAGLAATRAAAQASFDVVKLRYDAELALTKEARDATKKARDELAALRSRLIDTDKIKEALAELAANLNPIRLYMGNWIKGIEVAGTEFIETGLSISQAMVDGGDGPISQYRRWLTCYGSAFTPVPYQLGEYGCKADDFMQRVKSDLERIPERVLPEPFRSVYKEYLDVKARFRDEVNKAGDKAMVELVKLASPDPTTADFITLLMDPQNATAGKLNEVFGEVGDAGGKKLLVFPDAAAMFDKDLAMRGGRLTAAEFVPLRNAEVMARLSLLEPKEIRRLAYRLGGNARALPLAETTGRYSILYQTNRSIDGNHQWQPFGLPYARDGAAPAPSAAAERHFGWGGQGDGREGFPFFATEEMRREVFLQLFPRRLSGELARRAELAPGTYPFAECRSHPYPVAFEPGGAPAEADTACPAGDPDAGRAPRKPSGLIRALRSILDLFGGR